MNQTVFCDDQLKLSGSDGVVLDEGGFNDDGKLLGRRNWSECNGWSGERKFPKPN